MPLIIANTAVESYAIANDNGFVFSRNGHKELARLIVELAKDIGLRKQMGRVAGELVKRELNWNSITNLYLSAYSDVLMQN